MSMRFRDKALFVIHRDGVGDCTLSIKRYILWVIPHWLLLFKTPIHYIECLQFIKEWCCMRNIGTAIIHDPDGPNKEIVISYRRYPEENLSEEYELQQ